MIVLDTNVLSELMKARPAAGVVRWIGAQPAASLFTTSITQAEILHGMMLLPVGRRRATLHAHCRRARAGRPISHFDAQIAAIAVSTGASVATRNVADFELCGVKVIDPWEG